MKWALVVYFLVNGGWYTAESLQYDGWHRMHFESEEICHQYEARFNENEDLLDRIKGVCELSKTDILK